MAELTDAHTEHGNQLADHGNRLAKIEAHMEHMATKAWVLGGVVGGMVSAALITLAVARLVLQQ